MGEPAEMYRGGPIFYSVGNFAFGTGNSWAEGLAVGVRFEAQQTIVEVYPLYVKNRDPRVNYQPQVLRGRGAERVLRQLLETSNFPRDHTGLVDERLRVTLARAADGGLARG